MYCPMHLILGKLENLDIAEENTPLVDDTELPLLPIMANITVPVITLKSAKRVRERMRIDEPIDNITHQEHLKFEQLCSDFREFQDQLDVNENVQFPEDQFLRLVIIYLY